MLYHFNTKLIQRGQHKNTIHSADIFKCILLWKVFYSDSTDKNPEGPVYIMSVKIQFLAWWQTFNISPQN